LVAVGLWFSAGVVTGEENLPNDNQVSSSAWQKIREFIACHAVLPWRKK
jgi:hypothetical protein